MVPKTNAYVKRYDEQAKWMYFLVENDELLENIILFGIKSTLTSRNNLIANLSIIKNFEN